LQALSRSDNALSLTEISNVLGRSKAELYRMIQVLEQEGFVRREDEADGFILTHKLLAIGVERRPIKHLFEFAIPQMRSIAEQTSQSVHLAVLSGEEIVVIARIEAPDALSYSVRVGYRRPWHETASGRVLFAGLPEDEQERAVRKVSELLTSNEKLDLQVNLAAIKDRGFEQAKSAQVAGVVDLSVPIFDGARHIAALTVPFIKRLPQRISTKSVIEQLQEAAAAISNAIATGEVSSL